MPFDLNVDVVRKEKVRLNDSEARAFAITVLCREFELPEDSYISKDGKIVHDEEYNTSHSWSRTEVVRETPTEQELAVVTILQELRRRR